MAFEIVRDDCRKFPDNEIILPKRQTEHSSGYDIYSNETAVIQPGEQHVFWTDVKVKMDPDMHLIVMPRSSLGIKKGLILTNTLGNIDSDYYYSGREKGDGNIVVALKNTSDRPQYVEEGERIAQGVLHKYYTFGEVVDVKRDGGIGSTG